MGGAAAAIITGIDMGLIYSLNCKFSFLPGTILVFMTAVLMGTGIPKQKNTGAEIQAGKKNSIRVFSYKAD